METDGTEQIEDNMGRFWEKWIMMESLMENDGIFIIELMGT